MINKDPCLWLETGQDSEVLRSRMVNVNGKLVKHRFPQTGHVGDHDNYKPAPIHRYVYYVRHDGNVVAHVLTCAAADPYHAGEFGQFQMAEVRALGWFNPGQCPCALLATGDLRPEDVVSDEVRAGQPCPTGTYGFRDPVRFDDNCPHSKMERTARLARHAAEQAEIERSYKAKELIEAENQSRTLRTLAESAEAQAKTNELLTQLISSKGDKHK